MPANAAGRGRTWRRAAGTAAWRSAAAVLATLALAACAGAQKDDAAGQAAQAPAPGPDLAQATQLASVGPRAAQEALSLSLASVPALVLPEDAAARQALESAREAMQKRQWAAMNQWSVAAARDPVLGMYGRYWPLRRQVVDPTQPVPNAEIEAFLNTYQGTYLADRLRGEWIIAASRAGDHARAVALAPVVSSNSAIDCALLLSRHLVGQRVNGEQAIAAFRPGSSCWSMLDQLYESKVVAWSDVRGLLRDTLETNRAGDAQRVAAVLFDGADMVQYAALMKDPRKWLAGRKPPRSRAETELVVLALSRLARGNDRAANAAYIESQWAKAVPKSDLEWVWSQFGLVAALNVEPDAAGWYRRSGPGRLTDYNHAWQVRAELRQASINWDEVAKAIRRMSGRQAAEPVWVYWYARALDKLGNAQAARQHFESISSSLDFYGLLATEALGRPHALPPAPAPVTAAELREAQANPGLQRGAALFRLGWRPEAVAEWGYALRGMNDRQLRAAAELARQEHVYDRVINTSLLTRNEIDFSQRFVAPFEGRVSAKAREAGLDPAWVYGLIRQESRFIMDARSRVGASGLMQLMPATARWVAKRIGMKDFTPSSVNDFDTNTVLGTSYLSIVLNDLNRSEVLATAGYNAGPGRPRQWRAKLAAPVEGAIFAETIPFTETRLYVKHVMSNAMYYSMMFSGAPATSLTARLGTVAPAARGRTAVP